MIGALRSWSALQRTSFSEVEMIPLLDASANLMPEIAKKLCHPEYGQLITPLTNYKIHGGIFGVDNGGYTRQNMPALARVIQKAMPHMDRCKFVVAPDVPGSAIRTLELFAEFAKASTHLGIPLALACQDGSENREIPWGLLKSVFIAGTPDWRSTDYPKHIIAAAKWRGLWVHVGRVSTPEQWEYYRKLGADSADSSALVRPFPGRIDAISAYFKETYNEKTSSVDCDGSGSNNLPSEQSDSIPRLRDLRIGGGKRFSIHRQE